MRLRSLTSSVWLFVTSRRRRLKDKSEASVDHVDFLYESDGVTWWLGGLAGDDPLRTALELQLPRAELAVRLGTVLDATTTTRGPWRRRVEARYADTVARLARDACLELTTARCARAQRARLLWRSRGDAMEDVLPLLQSLGRVQGVLGVAPPRDVLRAAADAVDAQDVHSILETLPPGDSLSLQEEPAVPRGGGRPFFFPAAIAVGKRENNNNTKVPIGPSIMAPRAAIASIVVARARALRRSSPDDVDARSLRRRFRRKMITRGVLILVLAKGVIAVKNLFDAYGGARTVIQKAAATLKDVGERRVLDPAKAIRDDLLLNKKKTGLSDPRAFTEAERTLEQMLRDWLRDVKRMSKDERELRAKDKDMSSVNDLLAEEARSTVRNLVGGNIARALLIQLQFVSTEIYRAMKAIDDLLAANQATIQVLALGPAVFLAVFAARTVKAIVIALVSESVKSTKAVEDELAATFSDMSRIVVLELSDENGLDDAARGAVTTYVATLLTKLRRQRARFNDARVARLDRDLRDLLTPTASVADLKVLVLRLLADHAFLRLADVDNPLPPLDLLSNVPPPVVYH